MTDPVRKLAARACPKCATLQPLFVGRPGSPLAWQRWQDDVLACEGCGTRLRLEASERDPQGIWTAMAIVAVVTGVMGLGIPLAGRFGWSETAVLLLSAAMAITAIATAVALAAWRARGRRVVIVEDGA